MRDELVNRVRRRALLDLQFRALVEVALAPAAVGRPRSAAGDEARLRGIPVVGRGVRGEVPGTRPGTGRRLGDWGGRH